MDNEQRWKEAAVALLSADVQLALTPAVVLNPSLEERLDELAASLDSFGQKRQAAELVLAGLYLMNGSLDKSHELSQHIESATGSYWHGIMHRMEPDYWNAKYWFRKVGNHDVYRTLHSAAAPVIGQLADSADQRSGAARHIHALAAAETWDPSIWTDAVEQQEHGHGGAELLPLMKRLQWMECNELLKYSYSACFGVRLADAD